MHAYSLVGRSHVTAHAAVTVFALETAHHIFCAAVITLLQLLSTSAAILVEGLSEQLYYGLFNSLSWSSELSCQLSLHKKRVLHLHSRLAFTSWCCHHGAAPMLVWIPTRAICIT